MYLKKLEVVGFKSFAEPIQMEFSLGVMGIVGPNGSGKSNVIDCIRWVLGEQSVRSLRGSKLEDVIFAGSDTRKKLNMAEVTLILDNTDGYVPMEFQEISITRRVYRSGESDFYLNKKKCRLKDIVELFLDTGLSREAFSIIGQGKVEEILSSKPEDRRTIFEEAAGVLKYKVRKKKAVVKLEETHENLLRVEDVLYELEQQLTPIREQSEIATDYLHKKEQLKNYEVTLTVSEIESFHQKWNEKKTKISSLKNESFHIHQFLSIEEAKEEKWRVEALKLDADIEACQKHLLQATEAVQAARGKQEVLQERLLHGNKTLLMKKEQQFELSEKISATSQQIKQLEMEKKQLRLEIENIRIEIEGRQKQLTDVPKALEERLEAEKSLYIEKRNEEAMTKNEYGNIKESKRRIIYQMDKYDAQFKQLILEMTALNKQKSQVILACEQLESALNQQRQELNHLLVEHEKIVISEKQQTAVLNEQLRELQHIQSRKEALLEMKEEYVGYQIGTKEILKAAKSGQLQGIEGAVAECMTVPKGLEMAMETALGASMQHLIVGNEIHAQEAIGYLKQTKKGRATFLPLTVIHPRMLPNSVLQTVQTHKSFIGVAVQLIQFESRFSNVFGNLLGSVLIARDIKGANTMAKLLSYRYRIVTLEGDVLNPGGSMTGGSTKRTNAPLFTRARELETLQKKYISLSESVQYNQQQLHKLVEQNQQIQSDMAQMQNEIEIKQQEKIEQDAQIRELDISWQSLKEREALVDLEKRQLQVQLEDLDVRETENNRSLSTLELEIIHLQDKIKKLEQSQKEQTESAALLLEEITQARVRSAQRNEQLDHVLSNQKKEEMLYTELDEQVNKIRVDLEREAEQMEKSQDELSCLAKEIEEEENKKTSLEEKMILLRKERFEIHQKLEKLEKDLKQYQSDFKRIEGQLKQEEIQFSRLDFELENRLNFLREEYILTFEAAKEQFALDQIDENAVRKQVQLLRQAIEALGVVNLGAIEEFQRLDKRHTFLCTQKEDLIIAKDNLYQIIQEMDEEMDRRFGQTFFAIQTEFRQVFRQLFGGGHAELVLTTPSDLLTSGVEIIAQPPGKKLTNLSLLSGGERAFTAIALLFSILKVRPVPFCILDEVEAALDEANVIRFAQYIKQFSKDTQFIVITHRKGTMENCDVLYGVTMQESGVSKIVSVRMVEGNDPTVIKKVGK